MEKSDDELGSLIDISLDQKKITFNFEKTLVNFHLENLKADVISPYFEMPDPETNFKEVAIQLTHVLKRRIRIELEGDLKMIERISEYE